MRDVVSLSPSPFQIQTCTDLQSHVRVLSVNKNVCDKAFTLIKNLHRHAKSHESSTKIVCSICSEIFTRRDNLIRHKKEKH
ncbi:zinc finger and BTB domain-containing protein 24-like, partial [Aphis craccivora]